MILKTAMISESALTRKEADKMSFNVEKVKRKERRIRKQINK